MNAKNEKGETPLHKHSNTNNIKLLIENGADVNAKNNDGNTPLHTVPFDTGLNRSSSSPSDKCTLLFEKGADVNIKNNQGRTPFDMSRCLNLLPLIQQQNKKNDAEINKSPQETSQTPSKPITAPLFPLQPQELVEQDRLYKSQNENGNSLLHSMLKDKNPLQFLPRIHQMIKANVDINAKNNNGDTPLHIAFSPENLSPSRISIIDFLIKNGADVNAKNNNGDTPLLLLTKARLIYSHMLKKLVEKGADVNAKNNNGETPLFLLIKSSLHNSVMLKILIEKGADVNAKNNEGDTALHSLLSNRFVSPKDITFLIKKGANINVQNNKGETPLMIYLKNKRPQPHVVKMLIENGADLTLKDNDNKTAIDYASSEHIKSLLSK